MRIAPSIDADAVVLKVETSGVGIPTKKAERIFDEILAGPQGTQRLVSSSRRAVRTVGARPPGRLAHNITCPQRVVCCLVAAAASSLPVRRPASKDSPARRCSPWASSLCVDSRRVLHGNSVPREFMSCTSSSIEHWYREAPRWARSLRKRSRVPTWRRWGNRAARGVGRWSCAAIPSPSDRPHRTGPT
jgi:hypothetical protein